MSHSGWGRGAGAEPDPTVAKSSHRQPSSPRVIRSNRQRHKLFTNRHGARHFPNQTNVRKMEIVGLTDCVVHVPGP